ncbi:DUF3317 domain-containing [Olea europaea subsp. europaea]|uniref:DUF3317 domain-containing n=2 Tax=Olea europaea subsp. europaea TaxID=158383 RepID=A0A8S0UVD7_OLEEU|nr:DUF3317 domain-containing [Olea europaea subsp. europaea]
MNWIQRKIYLYNVTFGLYMLDWWERYLFNILVLVLMWFILYNSSQYISESYKKCLQWKMLGSAELCEAASQFTNGEGAAFIDRSDDFLLLTDDVGGWADHGVDVGQYARELICNFFDAIQEEPSGSIEPSGFCLHENESEGSFNCLYYRSQRAGVYHSCCSRIVVAGTDRLFDNLYNNDITAVTVVVQAADTFFGCSPSSRFQCNGGKLDDINVVVTLSSTNNKDLDLRKCYWNHHQEDQRKYRYGIHLGLHTQ